MIKSKVIELLEIFSEEEFKQFGLFLESPFLNKHKVLVRVYDFLKKYYPHFDNLKLSKKSLFRKIYPDRKYNDTRIRNLLSDLLEAAQEYLSTANALKDDFKNKIALMEDLIKKGQIGLYEKNLQKVCLILYNDTVFDAKHYENKYLLSLVELSHAFATAKDSAGTDVNKFEIYENLRIFFLLRAMYIETEISNSARDRFGYIKNPSQRKELERYIEMEAKENNNIIYVRYYYNMYKLGRTQDEKYYHELRDIIKNHFESLNIADKRNIFTALTNYCSFAVNCGKSEFIKEHFEIYRENIEKGYYLQGKYMTHFTYVNTVVLGLETGEIDWVENFIEKYNEKLDNNRRENSYIFCKALFFYHCKKYEQALEKATEIKGNDFLFKHQLKSLYLKIYFDMNEAEPFYSNIDGYKHFINSEKYVTAERRPVFLNYINFAKRLFDIKNMVRDRNIDFAKLKKEVISERAMINKPWLLKKIDEIEKTI